MGFGLLIALFLSFVTFILLFKFVKKLALLLLNGCVGIALFWLMNAFGWLAVPIDIVTFLIAAFGGIFGVAIVLILSALGVPL